MNIPNNLQEAVEQIVSLIPKEEQEKIKQSKEGEFEGGQHFFFGMQLRNQWRLWFNENPLCMWFSSLGINHGDDRSSILLSAVEAKIRGNKYDLQADIESFKKHWKKQGFKDGIHPVAKKN